MRRTILTLATTALVLLLAAPGHALHCNGDVIAISAGGETLYIDDRSEAAGEVNHWVYLESNAVDGLQSGGYDPCWDTCWPLSLSDPCTHPEPDTLIL